MRIVYMGTPDFASQSLFELIEAGQEIVGVFTKADTQKGRGMKTIFSPVKELAIENNIPVFQPNKLSDDGVYEQILELKPELIVVVAYGRILPQKILDIPKYGCVNVHGSLLPKYRGSAPIQWAILNGDKTTGITTMYMSKGLDEGDMILKDEIEILPQETSGELFERLKNLGGKTLLKTIDLIEKGTAPREKQDNSQATFAPMLKKEMGNLDFCEEADKILCKIYGLNPWPSASSTLNGVKFKILKAEKIENLAKTYECGTIFDINNGLCVACGDNSAILITEFQASGKKRMAVMEYIKGNKIETGTKFEKE